MVPWGYSASIQVLLGLNITHGLDLTFSCSPFPKTCLCPPQYLFSSTLGNISWLTWLLGCLGPHLTVFCCCFFSPRYSHNSCHPINFIKCLQGGDRDLACVPAVCEAQRSNSGAHNGLTLSTGSLLKSSRLQESFLWALEKHIRKSYWRRRYLVSFMQRTFQMFNQ